MKLFVTGANGFLGCEVVRSALERGHDVVAAVRPATLAKGDPFAGQERVQSVALDLRRREGLAEATRGCDAVLHLAAVKSGDFYAQMAGTVVATENLLDAFGEAGVRRLVHVSTFSIYDYRGIKQGQTLTEDSPLEDDPETRDDYCQTKLIQERLVREYAERLGFELAIIRPGTVFGEGSLWNGRLGMEPSRRFMVRIGGSAAIPLTYAANCADAVVLAAERAEAAGATVNIVDDETPTQAAYARLIRPHLPGPPRIVPVPLWVARFLAWSADRVSWKLCGGQLKVPSLFVRPNLEARCRPLRYSNERAKQVLDWQPRIGLREAVERSAAAADAAKQNEGGGA